MKTVLELLTVELQEERVHLQLALMLAVGMGVFCLLAGMTLTAAIVAIFWRHWHVLVLLALTAIYALMGLWLGSRLTSLIRDWESLSASLDQIRKDRACLEKILT